MQRPKNESKIGVNVKFRGFFNVCIFPFFNISIVSNVALCGAIILPIFEVLSVLYGLGYNKNNNISLE